MPVKHSGNGFKLDLQYFGSPLVAIEGGHGGYGVTPGKRTPDGEYEWDFNNKVVVAAIKRLHQYGIKTVRLDDPTGKTDVPLNARTNKANRAGADVLVSVHHNAYLGRWGGHTGTETYTYKGNWKDAEKLAKCVHKRMVGAYDLHDRGMKKANFHMLRESSMPAILTEGGYMDSTIDIKRMRDDGVLAEVGEAIADGVAEYFGYSIKSKATSQSKKPKKVETYSNKRMVIKDKYKKEGLTVYGKLTWDKDHKVRTEHNGFTLVAKYIVDGDPMYEVKNSSGTTRYVTGHSEYSYVEDDEEMLKEAIVIGSYNDYPAAEVLANRLKAPIYTRFVAEKEEVAKQIYVVGGGKDNLKADKITDLSGKDRFATMDNVKKYK